MTAVNQLATRQAWIGAEAGGDTRDKNSYLWGSTGSRMCFNGFNINSPRCCHTNRVTTGDFGLNSAGQSSAGGLDVAGGGDNLAVVCEYRCQIGGSTRSLMRSGNGQILHQV